MDPWPTICPVALMPVAYAWVHAEPRNPLGQILGAADLVQIKA